MLSQWVLRFVGRSQNCEKQLVASLYLFVCPSFRSSIRLSVHMEQVSYQWRDFPEM
jgi:hypothetical protein